MVKPVAAPPTAEAAAKPIRPIWNIRLRPTRSARRPPNSNRLPKANAYAVTTHCRSVVLNPRAFCAEGNAMFTTVVSSTTINWARPSTPRIHQRFA